MGVSNTYDEGAQCAQVANIGPIVDAPPFMAGEDVHSPSETPEIGDQLATLQPQTAPLAESLSVRTGRSDGIETDHEGEANCRQELHQIRHAKFPHSVPLIRANLSQPNRIGDVVCGGAHGVPWSTHGRLGPNPSAPKTPARSSKDLAK